MIIGTEALSTQNLEPYFESTLEPGLNQTQSWVGLHLPLEPVWEASSGGSK